MRGKFIVVLGTDGSGKSTLVSGLMPKLEGMFPLGVVVKHLKPDFLPSLGRFRGVKHEAGYVCRDPHGSPPSGTIGSLVRICYLTLDYILGYWLKVRRHLSKGNGACWLFDRYAYDMLLDPLRFRISLPAWTIRFFLRAVPKPDIVLCLGGDPVEIDRRKPEIGLEEVTRQVEALRSLCECSRNMHWVDTTLPLRQSLLMATNVICEN